MLAHVQLHSSSGVRCLEGLECAACGDVVVGSELDELGRCSTCGPAQRSCAWCGALRLAESLTPVEGDRVCPDCECQHDEAMASREAGPECCNGSGCARCV